MSVAIASEVIKIATDDGPANLDATGIRVYFEGVRALDGVDLALNRREILGVIGPNGAGKTTLVNVLTGFQRPTEGRFHVDGVDLTKRSPDKLARLGLARTFQHVRVFGGLTVFENVEAGAVGVGRGSTAARRHVTRLLAMAGLSDRASQRADSLPFGEEKRVGVLRAVAMQPAFLFLDEPAAGLNENETEEMLRMIVSIRDDLGCGVLIIEHNMQMIMNLCERIQVLDRGRTIAIGTAMEVQADEKVIAAYLGVKRSDSRASA